MATSKGYIEFLHDCFEDIPWVATRSMFGEYALYKSGKVIGLICDDICYIKITESTKKILWENAQTGFPYPWAKPQFIVPEETLENREDLRTLFEKCAQEVPEKKKKPKKSIL